MMRLTLIALAFFVLQCAKKEQAVDVTPFIGKWVVDYMQASGVEAPAFVDIFICTNTYIQQNISLKNTYYFDLQANNKGRYTNISASTYLSNVPINWTYDTQQQTIKISGTVSETLDVINVKTLRRIDAKTPILNCENPPQPVKTKNPVFVYLKKI